MGSFRVRWRTEVRRCDKDVEKEVGKAICRARSKRGACNKDGIVSVLPEEETLCRNGVHRTSYVSSSLDKEVTRWLDL